MSLFDSFSSVVDTLVPSNQMQGTPTIAGASETQANVVTTIGNLAGAGVAVYNALNGQPQTQTQAAAAAAPTGKPKSGFFDNFPFAGKRGLNIGLVAVGALALVAGAFFMLRKKKA